jgi:hypothetical protein
VTKGPHVESPGGRTGRVGFYVDVDGNRTDDPRKAVQGEIFDREGEGAPERTWFLLDEVQIKWLPMREGAFLLWVFVALVAVWVGIAVLLRLL